LDESRLDQIAKTGASVVAWEDKSTDSSTIAAIHARGWKAWVWTVDKPERVRELLAAKIDGIITNCPGQTRAVVDAALAK
jgi:glycerophosphoryl diester phosphodiesterase